MAKIWFFNPDNDVALAADPRARFTPPAAALELRRSGALLPMWWAAEGDEVLVESDAALAGARELQRRFDLKGRAVRRSEGGCEASPWGWSAMGNVKPTKCGKRSVDADIRYWSSAEQSKESSRSYMSPDSHRPEVRRLLCYRLHDNPQFGLERSDAVTRRSKADWRGIR